MVARTIYFGFGSNLWKDQMAQRCPTSRFLGVGRLNCYRWIINSRGYANVVEIDSGNSEQPHTPKSSHDTGHSYESEVWGLIYSLTGEDERRLDVNEGVAQGCYGKEILNVDFWEARESGARLPLDRPDEQQDMLVYVDREKVVPDQPKKEYIFRMNMGIRDAIKEGVPKEYVDQVMRRFIPDVEDRTVEEFARKQALKFEDEN